MSGTPSQPGTPGLLRAMNDKAALALLLEHGPLTRAQIGELTGLSKPTASQVVTRLEQLDLIDVVGSVPAARGPSAVTYAVRTDRAHAVAVDVRPHRVLSTLVDAAGTEFPVAEVPLARSAAERSAVGDISAAIQAACEAAGTTPDTVVTVIVGLQGAVDPRTDDLAFVGLIPGWPRKAVRAQLEDGLGVSVRIDNDVNLAAVAERVEGAGRDVDGFALLWMGDGLGLAVDLGGSLHRGASGGAGEIGYLPVPRAAAELVPSAKDLQDLIGGIAIKNLARAHGVRGRSFDAVLTDLATHPARPAVLSELATRVAVGVVPVLAVLDPPVVVLGGPTGVAGGRTLAEYVRGHIRRTTRWSPHISVSTVADHPVLRGARSVVGADLRSRLLDLVP
ncbi:MAG: ROK family transcriptional regulator [Cellulomonas sp.]